MRTTFICFVMLAALLFMPARGVAQAPPRWSDLPMLAAKWPPAWAALAREAAAANDFESVIDQGVAERLKGDANDENFRIADTLLVAALRHSRSIRRAAPLENAGAAAPTARLADRLTRVRRAWLAHLAKTGANAEALRLAESWLPGAEGSVSSAILALWSGEASVALKQADYAAARKWLDRADQAFDRLGPFDEIAKALQARAEKMLQDAEGMPDAQAIPVIEQALAHWPRLPGARDALERRRGTFRALVVAVPALPERLSPATACTEVEKQALALLFDRLYREQTAPTLGKRYRPQLATGLPTGALAAQIDLRKDVYWSSGERVTAADLRHTALLMSLPGAPGRTALWRDFLEVPRGGGDRFHAEIGYRRGLFDPIAPLTWWVVPQFVRGKPLQRGDDADFARAPVGSGPFQYLGRKVDAGKIYAVFGRNPHDLRVPLAPVSEIRLLAWRDATKDFAKPLPHLVLHAPADQRELLKKLGYVDVSLTASPYVDFLAVNHRKPSLASAAVRRAIAHLLDRQEMVKKHFPGEATSNGPFARTSWAAAPAPRVPEELHNVEQARAFARKAKDEFGELKWTLKYPAGDPRVRASCEEMARAIAAVFQEAKIQAEVTPQALAPHALRQAIAARDYDLAYVSDEPFDDAVRLALLFDRQDDALKPGGSNFLGYDGDVKLHELLRGVLQHRQFAAVQENMQAVHVHLYERMPLVPLWQRQTRVMALPSLRMPPLDGRAIFANVREWKIAP